MNEPLQAYLRVGLVHFAAYPAVLKGESPLASLAEVAADPFFQAVEVTRIPDPAERAAAAHLLAQSGMVVGYGAQPVQLAGRLDIGAVDESRRSAAVSVLQGCIDEAYSLGATQFVLLSGPNVVGPERAAALRQTERSLVELCAYSRSRGALAICLETFDYDVDKRALIGPNDLAAELSARVRVHDPGFGLLVDLSHLPLQHESIAGGLKAVKSHLTHAHVGNCILKQRDHPLYGDQHPRFGHPDGENGVPELTEFLRTLLTTGYLKRGAPRGVAFEVKPATGEESRVIVANAKRALLEAWACV